MKQVKQWYEGFIFGAHKDIYNPCIWSAIDEQIVYNQLDGNSFVAMDLPLRAKRY